MAGRHTRRPGLDSRFRGNDNGGGLEHDSAPDRLTSVRAGLTDSIQIHRALAAAGLTLARIAGAVIFLIVLARLGTLPLLAGFLCFLLGRMIVLRSGTGTARRTG